MPDEPGNTTTQTTLQPPPGAAAPSVPEDYEELQQKARAYDQVAPVLERLGSRWEDISPLVEDDTQLEYWRAARRARERQLEEQKPKLSPEMEYFQQKLDEKYGKVAEFVEGQQRAQQYWQQQQQQQAYQSNYEYGRRLIAERPDLLENNSRRLKLLINTASQEGLSLEQAWKEMSDDFPARQPKAPPPPSLRAGAAAPGVPGESTRPKPKSKAELTRHWAETLRKASR